MSGVDDKKGNRPSLRVFFTNWRDSKLPFHRKLALTFRNNWIKMRTRQDCCGHLGEPGCCEVERNEPHAGHEKD